MFILQHIDLDTVEIGTVGKRLERLFVVFRGMNQVDVRRAFEHQVAAWARTKGMLEAVEAAWSDYVRQFNCPVCGTLLVQHASL